MGNNIKTLKIGFKEVHKLNKWALPTTLIYGFFSSIGPFVNIYMSARIIDQLINTKDIDRIIMLVGITMVANLMIHLLSTGFHHISTRYRNIARQNQDMAMNEKIISMDYEHVEDSEVQTLRTKISESQNINGGGILGLINHTREFAQGVTKLIVSILISIGLFKDTGMIGGSGSFVNNSLFSYGFIVLVIAVTYINLKLRSTGEKKFFSHMSHFMDMNRILGFYINTALDYNSGKSIRLYGQKDIFQKELDLFYEAGKETFDTTGRIGAKYFGIGSLLSSSLGGLVYIFVGLKALAGSISIGNIVQYTGAINQFIQGSADTFSSINSIINNNQYLQLYLDFLAIEGEKYKGTLPVEKRNDDEYEIEFKNVSFKYPGTEEYVLKNISMKLNIGERLAIVGMNGSGKTTFIKLLSRLYDPNEGEILLNGINIKKYDYDEYLNLFSIVFQDFKLFSFSLGQNVTASVDYDEKLVKEVLEKAGLKDRLENMNKGIHTPLYKDFDEDGVEISGGEAQKIALARALYRNAPIIILDEPTAALDPIAEFEIYSKFNEIVGTKTAFYISHRLSSCRFCDEIAVFHEGEIIQKGNHELLLEDIDGKYYELWHSQAQYYNEEKTA